MSASTQSQELAALLFLYRTLLGGDGGNLKGVIRARRRLRLPVVLKGRRTVLPTSPVVLLQRPLQGVRDLHQADLAAGWGIVELPHALERKYRNAAREWAWLGVAVQAAGISKPATCHNFYN